MDYNYNWTEKQFQENLDKKVDEIYREYFGKYSDIKRISNEDNHTDEKLKILDSYLGIDTILYYHSCAPITFQEKILKQSKKHYQQITIEYFNNNTDQLYGDFFHCSAQYYFFAYATENDNDIDSYYIINYANLQYVLHNEIGFDVIKNKYLRQNRPPKQSDFFAIPIEEIKKYPGIIIYCKN